MKTIKNLTTLIDSKQYNCEIYRNCKGEDYFFVQDQPVDMKVVFASETINGYLVVAEDDCGERMSWCCYEK